MNCKEIKAKLAVKDSEVKSKKMKAREYFDLIKFDVLDMLIDKHIETNFEYKDYSIHCHEIVGFLLKKIKIENVGVFDVECWSICTTNMEMSRSTEFISHGSSQRYYEYMDFKRKAIDKFLSEFDSNYLINLIVDFLKSKGFKQSTGVHRFTDKKVYLFSFKISRSKLEKMYCHGDEIHSNENNYDSMVALIVLLLAIFLFILYRILM